MKIYDYILCSGSGNRFLLFDTLRSDLSGLNIAAFAAEELDRKSTRLNSSHMPKSRMPSSA